MNFTNDYINIMNNLYGDSYDINRKRKIDETIENFTSFQYGIKPEKPKWSDAINWNNGNYLNTTGNYDKSIINFINDASPEELEDIKIESIEVHTKYGNKEKTYTVKGDNLVKDVRKDLERIEYYALVDKRATKTWVICKFYLGFHKKTPNSPREFYFYQAASQLEIDIDKYGLDYVPTIDDLRILEFERYDPYDLTKHKNSASSYHIEKHRPFTADRTNSMYGSNKLVWDSRDKNSAIHIFSTSQTAMMFWRYEFEFGKNMSDFRILSGDDYQFKFDTGILNIHNWNWHPGQRNRDFKLQLNRKRVKNGKGWYAIGLRHESGRELYEFQHSSKEGIATDAEEWNINTYFRYTPKDMLKSVLSNSSSNKYNDKSGNAIGIKNVKFKIKKHDMRPYSSLDISERRALAKYRSNDGNPYFIIDRNTYITTKYPIKAKIWAIGGGGAGMTYKQKTRHPSRGYPAGGGAGGETLGGDTHIFQKDELITIEIGEGGKPDGNFLLTRPENTSGKSTIVSKGEGKNKKN